MERGLILLVAAVMVYMAPHVHGTSHLSFATNATVNITRAGCGVTKLCLELPDDCDPAVNGSCLFGSLMTSTQRTDNGTNLYVQVRGVSEGYVGLGLTVDASQGNTSLFICAQDSSSGTFFFRTTLRDNTNANAAPVATERRVTDIRGTVSGNVIRCEFTVPNVNASSQSRTTADTTFTVLIGTGPLINGNPGPFNVSINSGPLNVADPTSNSNTSIPVPPSTNSTTNTTVTGSCGAVHSQAVLILLGVLAWFAILKT